MASGLRPKYRPSGRFDVLRLAIATPLNLLVAVALGSLMAIIAVWYTYAIVLVPVALTLPLAVLGFFSAKWSRVRNPWMAAAVGIVLGTTMYLGQFATRYVIFEGNAGQVRADGLPQFIAHSVQRQFVYDPQKHELLYTTPCQNWAIFSIEIGLCMLGTGFGWYISSSMPYCERCGRFMRKRRAALQRGCATALTLGLSHGDMSGVPDSPRTDDPHGCRVELIGCSHGGQHESIDCFITTMDYGPVPNCEPLELSALTAAEYQAVVSKYPQLKLD